MDENYLDNLLNEFSLDKEIDNQIEDELSNQIDAEKREYQKTLELTPEDVFDRDLDLDASGLDFGSEPVFSEEQMNELDDLDDLADLDLSNVDFDDLDFDDLDVTKLDELDTGDLDELLKEFEGNLDVDASYNDVTSMANDTNPLQTGVVNAEENSLQNQTMESGELNTDGFHADEFLDDLLGETEAFEPEQIPEKDLNAFNPEQQVEELPQKNQVEPEEVLSQADENNLDDLFALLDLDDPEKEDSGMDEALKDKLAFMDDEEPEKEASPVKTKGKSSGKKTLMEILFGEEDEISLEEIKKEEEEREEKKRQKQKKKDEKKQAAKEKAEQDKRKKSEQTSQKKRAEDEKRRVRAEKKRILEKELAKEPPEKKLNMPMVIFIFSIFLGGVFVLYLASNNFNYTMAIQKAASYFDSQKYHKAYDEIRGVEVKEQDEDLKQRIYTVMYVERLYEAYENNCDLEFYDKALDSLLRGVDKYYEYYDEAVELGIEADIDTSFAHIQEALRDKFGVTVEQAQEINQMEDEAYALEVRSYVEANKSKLTTNEELTTEE